MTEREHVNRIIDEALALAERVDNLEDVSAYNDGNASFRRRVQLQKACMVDAILAYQKWRKLCPRCEKRPRDGSGKMCHECWIKTSDKEINSEP